MQTVSPKVMALLLWALSTVTTQRQDQNKRMIPSFPVADGIYAIRADDRSDRIAAYDWMVYTPSKDASTIRVYSLSGKLLSQISVPPPFVPVGWTSTDVFVLQKETQIGSLRNNHFEPKLAIKKPYYVAATRDFVFVLDENERLSLFSGGKEQLFLENVSRYDLFSARPDGGAMAAIRVNYGGDDLSGTLRKRRRVDTAEAKALLIKTPQGRSVQFIARECSLAYLDPKTLVAFVKPDGFTSGEMKGVPTMHLPFEGHRYTQRPLKHDYELIARIDLLTGIARPIVRFHWTFEDMGGTGDGVTASYDKIAVLPRSKYICVLLPDRVHLLLTVRY